MDRPINFNDIPPSLFGLQTQSVGLPVDKFFKVLNDHQIIEPNQLENTIQQEIRQVIDHLKETDDQFNLYRGLLKSMHAVDLVLFKGAKDLPNAEVEISEEDRIQRLIIVEGDRTKEDILLRRKLGAAVLPKMLGEFSDDSNVHVSVYQLPRGAKRIKSVIENSPYAERYTKRILTMVNELCQSASSVLDRIVSIEEIAAYSNGFEDEVDFDDGQLFVIPTPQKGRIWAQKQ